MRHIILLIVICFIFVSCSDDKSTGPDSGQGINWPDRTEKEDCIEIIRMVYEHGDIEKYKEVLLKPAPGEQFEDGYIWRNQARDYIEYGILYYYEEDWKGTEGIIKHAVNIHQFNILGNESDWVAFPEFRGEDCVNCWETIRRYNFDIEFDDGDRYLVNGKVQFIIGPNRDDEPNKYVIYQGTDIPL